MNTEHFQTVDVPHGVLISGMVILLIFGLRKRKEKGLGIPKAMLVLFTLSNIGWNVLGLLQRGSTTANLPLNLPVLQSLIGGFCLGVFVSMMVCGHFGLLFPTPCRPGGKNTT